MNSTVFQLTLGFKETVAFLHFCSINLSSSSIRGTSQGLPVQGNPGMPALRVTLLASEWSLSMGGLSTINRELATLLAKHKQVEVTLLVP